MLQLQPRLVAQFPGLPNRLRPSPSRAPGHVPQRTRHAAQSLGSLPFHPFSFLEKAEKRNLHAHKLASGALGVILGMLRTWGAWRGGTLQSPTSARLGQMCV